MSGKSLPAADLSGAFEKPSRAAGLRMPAKRTTEPRKTVTAVPAVSETATDLANESTTGDTDGGTRSQEAPQAPLQAVDGARARPRDRGAVESRTVQPQAATVQRPRRGRPPTAAADTTTNGARLVLWTPVSIRSRMQAVRNQRGTLYLDQVLDALESTVDELPELVHQATSAPVVQGRLFERTSAVAAQSDERRVQLTINGFVKTHIEVIDDLVASTGAPSRSALINAALNATLPEL